MKMTWRSFLQASIYLVAIAIAILAFQNCADSLPNEASSFSNQESLATEKPLEIVAPNNLFTGASTTLAAKGGTPPYIYSVVSGPATLTGDASLQAASSTGLVTVSVKDNEGSEAQTGIQIINDANVACVTPWGATVPPNGRVVAYKAATATCGGSCLSETQTCIAGALTGTFTKQKCTFSCFRWVNVTSPTESHSAACTRKKLKVAVTQGYGLCASSENRPAKGTDYAKITYTGSAARTAGGTSIVKSGSYYHCYKSGQTRNSGTTDRVAAYLCKP